MLSAVRSRRTTVTKALEKLRGLPIEDLGFARYDTHRVLRRGFPEVILAEGKTEKQVLGIDHTSAGRRLAQRWGLPEAMVNCIWLHHHRSETLPPSLKYRRYVEVVHLADLIAREQRRVLEDALVGLSERERAVFVLVELEGLERREAARTLGITSITVRRHLSRAHASLRAILAESQKKP